MSTVAPLSGRMRKLSSTNPVTTTESPWLGTVSAAGTTAAVAGGRDAGFFLLAWAGSIVPAQMQSAKTSTGTRRTMGNGSRSRRGTGMAILQRSSTDPKISTPFFFY